MSAVTRLAERIEKWTGIALNRGGVTYALERYIEKRTPELGFASCSDYVDSVTEDAPELRSLISVVTVPHSWFFRDAEQWTIVTGLLERVARKQSPFSAWIPGCASGEDAYTLAMIAAERGIRVEIVASDINSAILGVARRARYNAWAVREVPEPYRRFFHARGADHYELDESIRRMVSFTPHNLVHPPLVATSGHWDLVMCRNVFIYMSRAHVSAAVHRLSQALRLGGWLILGASDLVYSLPPELVADYPMGRLVFRRADAARISMRPARIVQPLVVRPVPIMLEPPPKPHRGIVPAVATDGVSHIVTQGNQRLEAGDYARAISLYETAQQIDPLEPEPYFFAGVAHHREGRLETAVQRLRSSLLLQPTLWPASLYLALCYEGLQRTEEASLEYRRVVEAGNAPLRLRSESSIGRDLEHWRREVVTLAKRRARPPPRPGHRR